MDVDECMVQSNFGDCDEPTKCNTFMLQCMSSDTTEQDGQDFQLIERPGIHDFLRIINEIADVYMFTAGTKEYGSAVAKHLDIDNKIFKKKLYRDSCTMTRGGFYCKDLTKIDASWDPCRTVLVDNAWYSFAMQPSNGINVKDFFGDQNDRELFDLQKFIVDELNKESDVRPLLEKKYGLPALLKKHHDYLHG